MTYFTETSEKNKPLTKKDESLLRQMVKRHYGPGPHPGTGTSQDVHGGNGTSREKNIRIYPNIGESGRAGWIFTDEELAERMKMVEDRWGLYAATNIDQSPSSSWMMPDGRVTVKLTEHEDLVALIGKYENLFASGFVRINIVKIKHGSTGAMSQYPPTIIHFQFDSRALNSKTKQAMSDVFWAMHYPKGEYKGTPGLGIDYWDAMGNEQAIREPVSRITIVGPEEFKRELGWRIDKSLTKRHYGPGPHPGTGTPQDVHGGGKTNLFVNDPRFPRPVGWTPEGFKKEKKRLVNYMAATYPAAPGVTAASWMAPDGTIYDVGRGGHQRSAINAFTKSGLWSEDQARASYHLGFHGPNEFIEYGFVRMYALNDANEFGFEMSSPDELTDAQRERLATEALKAYANGWRVVAGHSDRRLDLRRQYSEDDIRNLLGIVERGGPGSGHHGHAGRPGKVGGSQPGKGTGLGEFDFGSPFSRNDIRFSIDTMRSIREGLTEEQIDEMRNQFIQEVEMSLVEMEDALGIPIEGLVITNSLESFFIHDGTKGFDNPNMRQDLLGIIREESVGWKGAYTKGLVWLDDTPTAWGTEKSMEDPYFHRVIYHEVGHYLTTDLDRAAGISSFAYYALMKDYDALQPSHEWLVNMEPLYGSNKGTLRREYRADLIAAKVLSATSDKPIWVRGLEGERPALKPEDITNMNFLYSSLVNEFQKKYPKADITERSADEETVLVFFPAAGEIVLVEVSSLDELPPKAIILDQIFTR